MSVKYTAKYTNTTSVTQTVYINSGQPKIQVLTREPPILRIKVHYGK